MRKCECCKEENSNLIICKGYKMCPACCIGYVRSVKICENNAKYETEIDQLKQQLDESFTEEDVNGLIEDRDKTIEFLQKELVKKDKEIEEKMMSFEKRCQEYYKSDEFKKDFAIQELEKVKVNLKDRISMMNNEEHSYLQKVVSWYDICEQVNKQIKELKGEKDAED